MNARRAMLLVFFICMLLTGVASAQEEAAVFTESSVIAITACVTMVATAWASAWAIIATGVGAIGAIAEKPEVAGRVLIFTALAEAIAIYGLLIAFMLWTKV